MVNDVGGKVAARLRKLEHEIKGASRPAVNRAALIMKTSVDAEIVRVTGDRRLSGVGRGGARVGVRYDIKGTKNPTAIVRALGPLHFVERSTKAHEIKRRTRGRNAGRALQFNGTYRASVQHPGTRGRRPFGRGIDRARPAALKALVNAERDALKRGFSK